MDGLAQWAKNVKCYQADPACAVQFDLAEQYGLRLPKEQREPFVKTMPRPTFRPRQLVRIGIAQAHKLWRGMRYILTSERRKVDLRPEYFDV